MLGAGDLRWGAGGYSVVCWGLRRLFSGVLGAIQWCAGG